MRIPAATGASATRPRCLEAEATPERLARPGGTSQPLAELLELFELLLDGAIHCALDRDRLETEQKGASDAGGLSLRVPDWAHAINGKHASEAETGVHLRPDPLPPVGVVSV
jgi:hypothetical protein